MTVTLLEDNTEAVIAALRGDAAETRRAFAERIALHAQENAPVDSGALAASVYLVDERGTDYPDAVSAAQAKNDKAEILPQVAAEPDTTIVSFAVAYAEINEFYTGETNPGAHPFLTPAAEAERPAFEALGGRLT